MHRCWAKRAAIMASPLHQLTGFYLTFDCRSAKCGGERTFAISDLSGFYKDRPWAGCYIICGARAAVGRGGRRVVGNRPLLNAPVRPRRVPLLGPEVRGNERPLPLGYGRAKASILAFLLAHLPYSCHIVAHESPAHCRVHRLKYWRQPEEHGCEPPAAARSGGWQIVARELG